MHSEFVCFPGQLIRWMLTAVCCVCAIGRHTSAQTSDALLQESIAAWEDLAGRLAQVRGAGRYEISSQKRGGKVSGPKQTDVRFIKSGDSLRAELHGVKSGAEMAACANVKYAFRLERKTSTAPYTISAIEQRAKDDEGAEAITELFVDAVGNFLISPYVINGRSLQSLATNPRCKIGRVYRLNGGTLARMEFTFVPEDADKTKETKLLDCVVTMDTSNLWSIVEFTCNPPWGKLHAGIKYNDVAHDGFRYPASVIHRREGKMPGDSWTEERFTFSELEGYDASQSEFTLTDFGLPEPGAPSRRSYYVWIIVLALGMSLILVGIYIWRHRIKHGD